MTILCYYSCPLCGLSKVPISVPARAEEDVVVWMQETGRLMSMDHAIKSPNCHPTQLYDVMIPMIGVEKIGGPPVS